MQDYILLIASAVLAVGVIALFIQVLRLAHNVKTLEEVTFMAIGDKIEEKLNEYHDPDDRS